MSALCMLHHAGFSQAATFYPKRFVLQETVQAYDRTRALFQALSMAPAPMVAALEQSSWRFSGQEYTALLQVRSLHIASAYLMDNGASSCIVALHPVADWPVSVQARARLILLARR